MTREKYLEEAIARAQEIWREKGAINAMLFLYIATYETKTMLDAGDQAWIKEQIEKASLS